MISLILTLAIVGFVVYLITTYIPMAQPFKAIIFVIVAIAVILYLMRAFGVSDLPLPKVH